MYRYTRIKGANLVPDLLQTYFIKFIAAFASFSFRWSPPSSHDYALCSYIFCIYIFLFVLVATRPLAPPVMSCKLLVKVSFCKVIVFHTCAVVHYNLITVTSINLPCPLNCFIFPYRWIILGTWYTKYIDWVPASLAKPTIWHDMELALFTPPPSPPPTHTQKKPQSCGGH